MSFGSPIVFGDAPQGRQFQSLVAVSTQRDDPSSFDEKLLQTLIDKSPSVLPVREFLPSTSSLFSLGREVPVEIGGEGKIDNLLVTNDGYIVIVETKLYRNPEATRAVVTQTLQYGMAVGRMSVLELENKIREGQNSALQRGESIHNCLSRLATSDQGMSALLADDFEEALERHLRQGEVLLLVVSDSIRIGVERVTHWLNEQGNSSPFKFGLVELKFYTLGNQRLAIPRTVLKTREVSRHVVVVDIQPNATASVTAIVTDEFKNAYGGKMHESRSVRSGLPLLDKGQLLHKVRREDLPIVTELIQELESHGFDQRGTGAYLKFGFTFPADDGDFHTLAYLGADGLWTQALKPLRDKMSDEELREFHKAANQFGTFYRAEQIDTPHSGGSPVKYQQLLKPIRNYVAFLDTYRNKFLGLLGGD